MNPSFRLELPEGVYSGDSLRRLLRGVCAWLMEQGVQPGGTVVSQTADNQVNTLLLLALPLMNCAFLPLNPWLPGKQLEWMRRLGGSSSVVRGLPAVSQLLQKAPDSLYSTARNAEEAALLIPTSGTRSSGRVVVLKRKHLHLASAAANAALGLQPEDRWLMCLPGFHIGGLSVPLRCSLAGAAVRVLPGFDPQRVSRELSENQISHLSLAPSMLYRLLQIEPDFRPGNRLRVVLVGGAPMTQSLLQRATERGWPVCVSYGMSESAAMISLHCEPLLTAGAGYAGVVLPHVELKLGAEGRILLRGASIAEYAHTAQGRESLLDAQGWLETGDLGDLDERGHLYVLGRADDVLNSGGENIHPVVVENVLQRCPGIAEAAVTAIPDEYWGQCLVALYAGTAAESELADYARQHLQGAYRPKDFVKVERLPRNHMGKLVRGELPVLAQSKR